MAIEDDFEGTDVNWSAYNSSGWAVGDVSGVCTGPSAVDPGELGVFVYSDEDAGDPENYAKMDLPNSLGVGLFLRGPNSASGNSYGIIAGNGSQTVMMHTTDGVWTIMNNPSDITWSAGNTMSASVEGTSSGTVRIRVWQNPVGATPANWGDPDINWLVDNVAYEHFTGNYVGLAQSGQSDSRQYDNFSGGAYSSTVPIVTFSDANGNTDFIDLNDQAVSTTVNWEVYSGIDVEAFGSVEAKGTTAITGGTLQLTLTGSSLVSTNPVTVILKSTTTNAIGAYFTTVD